MTLSQLADLGVDTECHRQASFVAGAATVVTPVSSVVILRAGSAGDELFDVRELADDGRTTGGAGEVACGGHLGEHRPRRELVPMVCEQRIGVRPGDQLLVGRAESQIRAGRVGRHDEHVCAEVAGQQRARVVLVDHGLDPVELCPSP